MSYTVPRYSDRFSSATNSLEPRANPGKYVRWHERLPANSNLSGELTYRGGVPKYQRIPTQDDRYWEETSFSNSTDTAIDIPEEGTSGGKETSNSETSWDTEVSNELAPLVDGAAVVAEGAGLGFTTGEAVTGAGALALGSLGAYGIKKIADRVAERGATLPNSEYIGPFNPISVGAARNAGEQAAKTHDVNYQNLIDYAKTNEISESDFRGRVHSFDQSAIDEFDADWKNTGNWHSFVGKYGLKGKVAVEKAIGKQIYPQHPGKQLYRCTSFDLVAFRCRQKK